jgi:hypothetical protein
MGAHPNIGLDKFPKQSDQVNQRVETPLGSGVIVRDDVESPNLRLVRLDDGRVVMPNETTYPKKQGPAIGDRVWVCFNYKFTQGIDGTTVRDDYADPWLGILALDDGRFVLTTECQYRPLRSSKAVH